MAHIAKMSVAALRKGGGSRPCAREHAEDCNENGST